jgi:4-aminobutyrate aminotransferase-like enzyme
VDVGLRGKNAQVLIDCVLHKTLLDLLLQAFAGIVTVSVGHCHPEIVKAVNAQSELLQHTTTIYLNNQIAEYAKELADRMPGNLKVWHLYTLNMLTAPGMYLRVGQ